MSKFEDHDWERTIDSYIKEISHYSQMQVFATSHYQRNYFQHQIDDAANAIIHVLATKSQSTPYQESQKQVEEQTEILQGIPEEVHSEEVSEVPREGLPEESPKHEETSNDMEKVRIFTREELAAYDGSNGRAAYVAVDGTVYDVSDILRWAGGTHFGLFSGNDLSSEFLACHGGRSEVLNRLPIVGIFQQ